MPDEGQYSLSDDEIKSADFRTDPSFLPSVMKAAVAIEQRMNETEADEIAVPRGELERLRVGVLALIKVQTEFSFKPQTGDEDFGWDDNHGDRGSGCDYNPFGGINTGDLLPHVLPR